MIIESPSTGVKAEVSSKNRLFTDSVQQVRAAHISFVYGQTFNWVSYLNSTGGNFAFYIKNTDSTKMLRIQSLQVSGDAASSWELHTVTAGTPAGTALTGLNTNFSSGLAPNATAFGNAAVTGITGSTIMRKMYLGANNPFNLAVEGTINLSINQSLAIKNTVTANVGIMMIAWYE